MLVLLVEGPQSTGLGPAPAAAVAERAESYGRKDNISREHATGSAAAARTRHLVRGLDNGGKDRYATRSFLLDIR